MTLHVMYIWTESANNLFCIHRKNDKAVLIESRYLTALIVFDTWYLLSQQHNGSIPLKHRAVLAVILV